MGRNKIILVTLSPKTHRTSEENLGLAYLKASLVKHKYDVEIIDGWLNEYDIETVYNKIIVQKDELIFIGISSYMSNTKPTIELIDKIKRYDKNIKIACGGFGPTFYPKEYLESGSDYIMRGEGEKAICELAKCISNNQIPKDVKNVGYIENGKIMLNDMECLNDDLDSFPFPARDTLDIVTKKKSFVSMTTSRGCSGNCEFCSVISFFRLSDGKIWRTRSIKNIVDEIEQLYNKGVRHIKMVDDSFIDGIRNEEWCKEFADEIEKRNIHIKLRGQIRADKVTEGIISNLRRAGFYSFACGIENGSQKALTRMNKKATLEQNKEALKIFKKYEYLIQMGFILFDRDTTFDELVENYNFLKEFDFAVTKGIFSEMYSAEGTKLNNKLDKENDLIKGDFLSLNNRYNIKNDTVRKVYELLKMWHKCHSSIYDMTIDPLTAPKAIDNNMMKMFYINAIELKKVDLEFFGKILKIISKHPEMDIKKIYDYYHDRENDLYSDINRNVQRVYRKSGLNYNADVNPFL